MSSLLSLRTELLAPVLRHTLTPIPTSMPTIRALSLTHPRLYNLILHLLKQILASYEAVGTNQLLPHPYSRKDENGDVLYQDFQRIKAGMERIVEWRWVRWRLPAVIVKLETGLPEGGFRWEHQDEVVEKVEEFEEAETLDALSSEVARFNLQDHGAEAKETAEDKKARARLTSWLLGKKYPV